MLQVTRWRESFPSQAKRNSLFPRNWNVKLIAKENFSFSTDMTHMRIWLSELLRNMLVQEGLLTYKDLCNYCRFTIPQVCKWDILLFLFFVTLSCFQYEATQNREATR